ncbi:DUF3578 domain-containing protein [Actinosynnema sp. NPDC020468]|uniref:MrcB family domain-containing protein n=1 Tax=Actinosynnema sp. NPDC020468 TaxID=3154488 RepID=UPI003403A9D4
MREVLERLLPLQPLFSDASTPDMRERGRLLNEGIRPWLADRAPLLNAELPFPIADLEVGSSDGIGRRSRIPWARVHSAGHSPNATSGWYVVLLPHAWGECAYLCLIQGAMDEQNEHPRPVAELERRGRWARAQLSDHLRTRPDLLHAIDLGAPKFKRAKAYEVSTALAFGYPAGAVPAESVLEADLAFLLGALSALYREEEDVPERVFLTPADRRAVRRRAVEVTSELLRDQGYEVSDMGGTRPYDLHARKPGSRVFVLARGTTEPSADIEVDLTADEAAVRPNTLLSIVTAVKVDPTTGTVSGGTPHLHHNWHPDPTRLIPLTYRYRV